MMNAIIIDIVPTLLFSMVCICLCFCQPDVRVLNYAPGPLSTDMYDEICNTCGNQDLAAAFRKGQDEVSQTVYFIL